MHKKSSHRISKSQVNKAGRNIRLGKYDNNDVEIVEAWRASHAYILNTFQANLRRRSKGKSIIVAERLKRRSTIFDKIIRQPTMALSNMQDIAGCRLIFKNTLELRAFIKNYEKARFEHIRVDDNRYDYLRSPKKDGYRGVHQVYEFHSSAPLSSRWNGLCIEIQFRTVYQHAWATAVEIVGYLGEGQAKFGRARPEVREFFCLTSEILARAFENSNACFPELAIKDLLKKYHDIEKKLSLLSKLEQLSFAVRTRSNEKNIILSLGADQKLEIFGFKNDDAAIRKYFELERQAHMGADIVLVRSGTYKEIKNAYRNYFGDARAFVGYIRKGIEKLHRIHKQDPHADKQMRLNLEG